jgi:subfamily B ATP-binding cassette protein MsbA
MGGTGPAAMPAFQFAGFPPWGGFVDIYKRLLRYAYPYRWKITGAFVCNILGGLFSVSSMVLIKPVIDKIFNNPDQQAVAHYMVLLPLAIILVMIFKGLFNYLGDILNGIVGNSIAADLRKQLFTHLQGLPLSFHQGQRGGELLSRFTSDIGLMPAGITDVLSKVIKSGFNIVFYLIAIFYMDWKLALWVLIVFPVAIGPLLYFGRRIRKHVSTTQERQADLVSMLHESLAGVRVVMAFGMEKAQVERFTKTVGQHLAAVIRQVRIGALSGPVMEAISGLGLALLFFLAGRQVQNHGMTTGTFLAFVGLIASLYPEIKNLNGVNQSVQTARSAGERVFQVLDTRNDIVDAPDAQPLSEIRQGLRFEKVAFHYQAGTPVLKDIDLEIKAGQMVALVGPSGAGKSTLADLVPRFMDPSSGTVRIDGHDLRRVTLASLRGQIGVVTQETFLFNDTIAVNIGFGRPDATQAEIEGAARAANAHAFILEQPQGYQTRIGDRGARLSGGQRQRLAIARAILKNPPILILDEATSALDTESERAVQEALEHLMARRTSLVIAHRLSTVQQADRIVVLEEGRVVEQGRHDELLALNGLYAKLHKMQFREG